ncbi:IS30 family transposase [Aggregatibacter actinomycetemcomitans]|uniref:IS30 family transposase n=1 Tax=Aggregatibacter actinomycetemcomitans TaxID=714 RepID=UPI00024001E6|nr:IS30 family transposase [Aggregatibacter actinomycetemcomitans]EHK90104.1 transposase for insertion sequence element ISApl1 [Aggregatibacter actinomycetemcomitans RhAA1]
MPMNTYTHLTQVERENILIMHSQGKNVAEIARLLGRHRSTITRELKRLPKGHYSAILAQQHYQQKRRPCKAAKKLQHPDYYRLVQDKFLYEQWSPEQISRRLKYEKSPLSISYATIYRGIKEGLFDVGERKATRHLRRKGKTRHMVNHEEKRGKIVISNPLERRPKSAKNRSRFGHWEADMVLGKVRKACLVTLTDRKSRFLPAKKVPAKQSELVKDAMIALLKSHKLRSITPDRGKEFAKHRKVTKALGVEFYFPEPHQPWQRGTNENTNGLLREYFPKQADIGQWDDNYIRLVVDKLNLRPRKCLGRETAFECYFGKSLHLV